MRSSALIRALALLMALCLLSGCGSKTSTAQDPAPSLPEPDTTQPPASQEPMPQAQLQDALDRTEYSLLAAALSAEHRIFALQGYVDTHPVYIGDVDKDGQLELAHSGTTLLFDIGDNRNMHYIFEQSGTTFHVGSDGTFYMEACLVDGYPESMEEGRYICYDYYSYWYNVWDGSQWTMAMGYGGETVQEAFDNPDGYDFIYGDILEQSENFVIGSQNVTQTEYDSYVQSLGLTEVTTSASDYTVNLYDAIYADSLLSALESRLRSEFSATCLRQDIDGDGQQETVFAVPGLLDPYISSLDRNATGDPGNYGYGYYDPQSILHGIVDLDRPHTGILIADTQGDKLVLSSYCAMADVSVGDGMDISFRDHCLWLDGTAVYAPSGFDTLDSLSEEDRSSVFAGLTAFLEGSGYTQPVLKMVDLGDAPGSELLCLCQKDGQWHLLIFAFRNGAPVPLWTTPLSNSAVYLTQISGQPAILSYHQTMYQTMGGQTYTGYNYAIYRFDAQGQYQESESQYVYYYDDDADATAVAQFFEKFNTHLLQAVVIADPYQLHGNYWLLPEDADYGTVPASPEPETEQSAKEQLGFVQINNPSSWLNLREGPGTDYPRVLTDPSNPNSFVRQALGAPVTVLETIETGDPENPVWVKIRITYAEQEIVGYSSKTYIRLADES